MILIFGGAYQGKKEFAFKTFGLTEKDVEYAGDENWFPGESRIICGMENFSLACVRAGLSALDRWEKIGPLLNKKIILIDDISQGIVPIDAMERAWREDNGRLMIRMAAEAQEVYRVFMGIGSRIK